MLKYYFKALKAIIVFGFLFFFSYCGLGFFICFTVVFFQTLVYLDCFTQDTVILNTLEEKWLHKDYLASSIAI